MQNVMHLATNSGHTEQNDDQTMQNDGRTMQDDGRTKCNVGRITLNVSQGPKGGLEEPPRAPGDPPTPILEKTLVSRNDFKDIRNKKNKNIKRKKNFHPD